MNGKDREDSCRIYLMGWEELKIAKYLNHSSRHSDLFTHSLTHSLTPWCATLFEKLIVTQLVKKYPFFMEPEGSLPFSQKPAIGPCPGPAESRSPHGSLCP